MPRGEEAVADVLARRCPRVTALHYRKMPSSRANIDHLAVAPSGVHVIDTKRYRGKIEVRAPLAVIAPDVEVHGCLCFVAPEGLPADSGLPLIRTLRMRGFPLLYPRRLAKSSPGASHRRRRRSRGGVAFALPRG